MNSGNYKCIVVGPIHYNTLNVIRSLAQNGNEPLIILVGECKTNFVTVSKYVKRYINIENYDLIVPCLHRIAKNIKKRLPLISINDKCTSVIDSNYNSLCDKFILPNCKHSQGSIIQEMLKSRQLEVASKCGFNTPKSTLIKPIKTNIDELYIEFPCIIKPAKSIDGSKSEMIICHKMLDIEQYFHSLTHNHELLIQQYIPNNHFFLIAGVRCENGHVVIPGVIEKIKKGKRNNTLGLNAFGKLTKCDSQIIDKCKQYLDMIDYHGIFSFEFANQQTKNVNIDDSYFIELNLRTDGLLFFYNAAGISLPKIWAENTSQIDRHSVRKDIYGINETVYITEYLKEAKVTDILKDILKTDCWSYFSIKDPRPFFKKFFKI